jgi:hypothetical protein
MGDIGSEAEAVSVTPLARQMTPTHMMRGSLAAADEGGIGTETLAQVPPSFSLILRATLAK